MSITIVRPAVNFAAGKHENLIPSTISSGVFKRPKGVFYFNLSKKNHPLLHNCEIIQRIGVDGPGATAFTPIENAVIQFAQFSLNLIEQTI